MNGNIYLIGFMGSGKSTVGRELSARMGRKFLDMDDILEKQLGRSITEIFNREGEAYFRARETALLKKLGQRKRLVVATGGGAPVSEENRRIMENSGQMVHLSASFTECEKRITPGMAEIRPLWRDRDKANSLYIQRESIYKNCGIQAPADGRSPFEIVVDILKRLAPDVQFQVDHQGVACPVTASMDTPRALADLLKGRRAVLLTDRNVDKHHGQRFRPLFSEAGTMVVPPGEKTKTLRGAEKIYRFLLDGRFDRGDVLVALGGGMVTDLGAYVASTYKRGMDFILISTSLVGCVDAAVGGKSAVNFSPAKNIIGCFTTPRNVLLDTLALSTLKKSHRSDGLVEAYKTGLVADPDLATLIETENSALTTGDLLLLAEVATRSARTKGTVVADDFRESGRRAILNFGHTFGHAVESWHNYRISHGMAVAVGMMVAVRVSQNRGLLTPDQAARTAGAIRGLVPRLAAVPPIREAWDIMLHDKKIKAGKMVFVLLEGPGRPVLVNDVSPEELETGIAILEE